jgi:hypothetical protein
MILAPSNANFHRPREMRKLKKSGWSDNIRASHVLKEKAGERITTALSFQKGAGRIFALSIKYPIAPTEAIDHGIILKGIRPNDPTDIGIRMNSIGDMDRHSDRKTRQLLSCGHLKKFSTADRHEKNFANINISLPIATGPSVTFAMIFVNGDFRRTDIDKSRIATVQPQVFYENSSTHCRRVSKGFGFIAAGIPPQGT